MRLLRRRTSTPAVAVVSADTPPVPPLPSRHNYPDSPDRSDGPSMSPRTPRGRRSSLRGAAERDQHMLSMPGPSTSPPLPRSARRQHATVSDREDTTSGCPPVPGLHRSSPTRIRGVSWTDGESLDFIVSGIAAGDGGARERRGQSVEGFAATWPRNYSHQQIGTIPGSSLGLGVLSPPLSVSPASIEDDDSSRALLAGEAQLESGSARNRHARKLTKRRPRSAAPPVSFARHQRLPDVRPVSPSIGESGDSVNRYATLRPLDPAFVLTASPPSRRRSTPPRKAEIGRQHSLSAASGSSCNQTDESCALKTPEGAVCLGEEAHWPPLIKAAALRGNVGDASHSTPSPRFVQGRKAIHRPTCIRQRSSSLEQSATRFDSIYSIGEIHTASRLEAMPASTVHLGGTGTSIEDEQSAHALSDHDATSELPYLDGQKTRLRSCSTRPAPPPPHLHIEIPEKRSELFRTQHEPLRSSAPELSAELASQSPPKDDEPNIAHEPSLDDAEHSLPTAIPRRGSSLPTTSYMPLGSFTPPLYRARRAIASSAKMSASPSETSTEDHANVIEQEDTYEVRRAHRQSLVDITDDQVFHETLTALLTSSGSHQSPAAKSFPEKSTPDRDLSQTLIAPVQIPRSPRESTNVSAREQGIAAWFVTREIVQGERRYGRSLAKGLELIQHAIDETQDSVPPLPDISHAAVAMKRASTGFRSTPSSPRISARWLARPKSVHAGHRSMGDTLIAGGRDHLSSPHPFVTLQRHLPDLLALSVKLSDTFEHDPSPYAVSDAFVSLEDDITRELARWAGVLGNVFAMNMGQSLKGNSGRSWRGSSYGDVAGLAAEERLGLTDIIIMPIQRAARYRLLFEELMTKMPAESNTRRKVDAATRAAERLASKCNARQTFDLDILRRGYHKPSSSKRNRQGVQSADAPAVKV